MISKLKLKLYFLYFQESIPSVLKLGHLREWNFCIDTQPLFLAHSWWNTKTLLEDPANFCIATRITLAM